MTITAADVESRTLTGRIVTWGEEGNTSAGRTVFSKDSIAFNKNVKLLLEHELTRPIGKMVSAEVTDTGSKQSSRFLTLQPDPMRSSKLLKDYATDSASASNLTSGQIKMARW